MVLLTWLISTSAYGAREPHDPASCPVASLTPIWTSLFTVRKVQDFQSYYGFSLICFLGDSRAQWAWIWALTLTVLGLDSQLCYLPSVCPWTSWINLVSFIWNTPCWEQQWNNRLVPLSIQYSVKGSYLHLPWEILCPFLDLCVGGTQAYRAFSGSTELPTPSLSNSGLTFGLSQKANFLPDTSSRTVFKSKFTGQG